MIKALDLCMQATSLSAYQNNLLKDMEERFFKFENEIMEYLQITGKHKNPVSKLTRDKIINA